MKQNLTLSSSIAVLTGAVITVLALTRGAAQTSLLLLAFALWGMWVVVALLRPAWKLNRAYRAQEDRRAAEREAFSDVNVARLLLCHVNCRISDCLRSTCPDARWEWTMHDPALFAVTGGTGRIRVWGIPDYEYADVTLDRLGGLSCSLVQIAPVRHGGQSSAPDRQPTDPQAWYGPEGQRALEAMAADLRSRGHSGLTLHEDGSISIWPAADGALTEACCPSLPERSCWPQLADALKRDGLSADVRSDGIVIFWQKGAAA